MTCKRCQDYLESLVYSLQESFENCEVLHKYELAGGMGFLFMYLGGCTVLKANGRDYNAV